MPNFHPSSFILHPCFFILALMSNELNRMLTDTTISGLIAKLGCLDSVPGVGGGETGYRPLDEGEVAAATLVACGEAAIPELIRATKSNDWTVRYRCADVLGIIGSEAGLPALVGLLSDANWHVQQSAMLALHALIGASGEDLAASYLDVSAFMDFCHRTSRFDILTLLARHGSAEIRTHADRLLNQQGSPARRTVLDATLSYAEKKRNLEALQVDVNWVCDQIQKKGTEQERASAAQFLHHWRNDSQGLRAGSAPPRPSRELLRAAAYSPPVTPAGQLLRPVDEPGPAPVVSSAPKPGRRLRLSSLVDALSARFQGTPRPSAPKPVPLLEVPAPSLETYAMRTCARRWLSPVAGMEMILIPAGAFLMGDDDQSDNRRRTVSLDAYWISRHSVTVKQYRKFCSETGHALPKAPSWGWKDDHPIVNVSWNDAVTYCDWLSKEIGHTVTLPTEAQWEKAARGPDGRQYPWGSDFDDSKLWCSVKTHRSGTCPVGQFTDSPYGLSDMAGNVWQWCSDWYDENYYKTSPDRNPSGPASGRFRVLRGGSWGGGSSGSFRCADRHRVLARQLGRRPRVPVRGSFGHPLAFVLFLFYPLLSTSET
jgi:formylglycine-generating enzyme